MKFKDLTEAHLTDLVENWNETAFVIKHYPNWMAKKYPDLMVNVRPDLVFENYPAWMAEKSPDWVKEHHPDWLSERKREFRDKSFLDYDESDVPQAIQLLLKKRDN